MDDDVIQHLQLLSDDIVRAWSRIGKSTTMKWHILGDHLVDQMRWAGNSRWSHNYADESENHPTAKIGRSVHPLQHAKTFLVKWYAKDLLSK